MPKELLKQRGMKAEGAETGSVGGEIGRVALSFAEEKKGSPIELQTPPQVGRGKRGGRG